MGGELQATWRARLVCVFMWLGFMGSRELVYLGSTTSNRTGMWRSGWLSSFGNNAALGHRQKGRHESFCVLCLWYMLGQCSLYGFFLTSCVTLYFEQEVPQPLGDFSMQLPGNYMVASSSTSLENPWLSKRQCARYRVRMPMLVLMYVHCDHLARIGIDNSLALKRLWDMSYGMHPPGIQYEYEKGEASRHLIFVCKLCNFYAPLALPPQWSHEPTFGSV